MSIWTLADWFIYVAIAGAVIVAAVTGAAVALITAWILYALVWTAIRLDTWRRT